MQPQTTTAYKQKALERLKRKIAATRKCNTERDSNPAYALPVPFEIGLKLTNRCDLRCTHCFQWNDSGYHYHMDKSETTKSGDLDIAIIKDAFEFTKTTNAMVYLWGGEPLIYDCWPELVNLLREDPRETVICTNGLSIGKHIDDLCSISEHLTMLVSIEGTEELHNSLRGKNSFKRTMQGLDLLLEKRLTGEYKGFVSVAAVLSDDLIDSMHEFCSYFEDKGIDTLYINFPWFIPEDVSFEMDELFKEKFSWMGTDRSFRNSWHSFDFHVNPEKFEQLLQQIKKLNEKTWNVRIRFQPDLDETEMLDFIKGGTKPAQKKTRCLGISNRLDILPNGTVTPCKKFIEFSVGNLHQSGLQEVWQGIPFSKFRELHNNTLMPICSKCEILYMNGM
jgi:radical SAM protein with 4Fe4S-binding SPASM domain